MAKIERFEDLAIWHKGAQVAITIYALSDVGKLKSDTGAKDQIRRSATSISNNIAEGFEYNNNREFIRFLRFSKGSCGELRSQLFVLSQSGFIAATDYKKLYQEWLPFPSRLVR